MQDIQPKNENKRFLAVDLFCGCGGVTEGLKKSNFNVFAALDNNQIASDTYKNNHPEVQFYNEDITTFEPQIIKDSLSGKNLDLLVVCAPCQPFSSQNKNKSIDPRTNLILQGPRFAAVLNPKIIFFENVPGLTGPRFKAVLEQLESELKLLGYVFTSPQRVDAADHNVPQRRIRCVMIASKLGNNLTLPSASTPRGKRVTVRKSIGHLSPLSPGQNDVNDKLHFASKHSQLVLTRLQHIPLNGGDRFALPEYLQLKCHIGHTGHPDVYGRMFWDDVAPTLTTGCTDVTKGRFAHPRDNRSISIREAALLQTFPEDYKFSGTPTQIATQIGNAVPVELAKAIADNFSKQLRLHNGT